jgi:hypothetical protein
MNTDPNDNGKVAEPLGGGSAIGYAELKRDLIAKGLQALRDANQINERDDTSVENWVAWYDAILKDVTDAEVILGAMKIELLRRRGETLLALGKNPRGDQRNSFRFGTGTVKGLAGRESEARLVAKQYSAVEEYVKTEVAARRKPSAAVAIKVARNAQPKRPKTPKPPKVRRFASPDIHLPHVDSTGTTKPHQKVHLHPAREEQLLDDGQLVSNLEMRISTLGRPLELVGSRQDTFAIDLETFKASIGRMLAYDKGKYRKSDFVAEARRALGKIDSVIDRQIDWLIALRDFVRSAQPPATKANDEVSDGPSVGPVICA